MNPIKENKISINYELQPLISENSLLYVESVYFNVERVRRLHGQLAAAHSMTQQYYGVDDSSDYEFFDSDDAGGPDADPAGADAVVVAAATDAT